MSANSGTPLYLEVEAALEQFKTGVSNLRNQQAQTENLLAKGGEALENLVQQMSRLDSLKKEVESDLRLLERFRQDLDKRVSSVHDQVQTELTSYQQSTRKSLENIKRDISLRRQEMLGQLETVKKRSEETDVIFNRRLSQQRTALDSMLAKIETKLRAAEEVHEHLGIRLGILEQRNKILLWGVLVIGAIALTALFL